MDPVAGVSQDPFSPPMALTGISGTLVECGGWHPIPSPLSGQSDLVVDLSGLFCIVDEINRRDMSQFTVDYEHDNAPPPFPLHQKGWNTICEVGHWINDNVLSNPYVLGGICIVGLIVCRDVCEHRHRRGSCMSRLLAQAVLSGKVRNLGHQKGWVAAG